MLFGVVIILGAFYVRDNGKLVADGSVVALPAPERTAITTKDSDGNGVEDWEENLQERFFETISVPTSTVGSEDTGPYEPPTTLTGKFSEAFLKDYLEGKVQNADFSDPTALVGGAVKAIDGSTRSKRYTQLQVAQVPTTQDSVREYGNRIAEIVAMHSIENENEAVILQRALDADDPALLEPLAPIQEVYEKVIRDALLVSVPDALTDEHVAFLNASEAIKTDIGAMRVAFTDPLYTLARMRSYEADATSLFNALTAMAKTFDAEGVRFRNDELGAAFSMFEI
jgi:hypothetical protein